MIAWLVAVVPLLGLPLLAGWALLANLGLARRRDPLGWWAWCWIAGALVTAAWCAAWLASGLPLRSPAVDGALAVVALAALAWSRRPGARGAAGPAGAVDPMDPVDPVARGTRAGRLFLAAALSVVALQLALRAWLSRGFPTAVGDEALIWMPKAMALWLAGTSDWTLARLIAVDAFGRHPDYPLFDPLLQAWAFVRADGITWLDNRLPIQAFAPALVLAVAAGVRRLAGPAFAGAVVLALGAAERFQLLATVAMADLMVAASLAVCLDALLRGIETGERAWLRLAALAAVALAWTKHDAVLHLAALGAGLLAAALAAGRGNRAWLRAWLRAPVLWVGLALAAAVVAGNQTFARAHGFTSEFLAGEHPDQPLFEPGGPAPLERLPVVVPRILRLAVLDPAASGRIALLGLLLLAPLVLRRPRPRGPDLILPLATWLAYVAGAVVVYLVTPRELGWHLDTSAARVVLQALPAAALWSAGAAETLTSRERIATPPATLGA